MKLVLGLLVFLSLAVTAPASKNLMRHAKPMPVHSHELEELNVQRTQLQKEKNAAEQKQDFWHSLSIGLAVCAGGIAILAGAAQFRESSLAYSIRRTESELANCDSRIRFLEEDES